MVKKHPNPWLFAIFTGVILVLFVWFIQYGFSNKPLIDYKLKCDESLSASKNLGFPETIEFQFRNRGKIDAPVFLIIEAEGIVIEPVNDKPYVNKSKGKISYAYTLSRADSSDIPYSSERVKLIVNDSVDFFRISSNVEKRFTRVSNIFSKVFGEINGYYPTSCTYNYSAKNRFPIFELVE